jgi:hypothetical protein
MARTVTARVNTSLTGITVRAGDTVLGQVGRLGNDREDWLAGRFTNAPAYSDHAHLFEALRKAIDSGTDEAATRTAIEAAGLFVHHADHDMRIDVANSLTIDRGEVRFRANPAFQTMRSGGL